MFKYGKELSGIMILDNYIIQQVVEFTSAKKREYKYQEYFVRRRKSISHQRPYSSRHKKELILNSHTFIV